MHSLTMAVGYVVGVLSLVIEIALDAADYLNADQFKAQLSTVLSNNPVLMARLSLVITILFILARVRTLRGGWGRRKDDP